MLTNHARRQAFPPDSGPDSDPIKPPLPHGPPALGVIARFALIPLVIFFNALLGGCNQSSFDQGVGASSSPQEEPLSDPIGCKTDNDCAERDICLQGICQIERCGDAETLPSTPPLGSGRYLQKRRELAFLQTEGHSHTWQAYKHDGTSWFPIAMESSPGPTLSSPVKAITGGNLLGIDVRPEPVAITLEGSHSIRILTFGSSSEQAISIPISFPIKSLTAGDVDNDGVDEVIALGTNGDLAICQAKTASCHYTSFPQSEGLDVTAADIDGDGASEVVALVQVASNQQLKVWKAKSFTTASDTLQQSYQSVENNLSNLQGTIQEVTTLVRNAGDGLHLSRIRGGDLNGDGKAEVLGLETGNPNWILYKEGNLHIFQLNADNKLAEIGLQSVNADSKNFIIDDTNGDGRDEVLLLRQPNRVEVLEANNNSPTTLKSTSTTSLPTNIDLEQVTAVDVDSDSTAGRLRNGPITAPGGLIPIAVLELPPYSYQYSQNAASTVTMGNAQSINHLSLDSIQISFGGGLVINQAPGIQVFTGLDLRPGSDALIKGKILNWSQNSRTEKVATTAYTAIASPEKDGVHYAQVVLASACYHLYTYEVIAPHHPLSQPRGQIHFFLPIKTQVVVRSTNRYNALARSVKGMPIINIPYQIGEPTSYPATLSTLAGQPVNDRDILFQGDPITVSPSVRTNFSFSIGQSKEYGQKTSNYINVRGGPVLQGLGFGIEGNLITGHEDRIQVAQTTSFSGSVPPIESNPETPVDEWKLHAFSFVPHLTREHYEDAAGNETGYYVLSYTVPNHPLPRSSLKTVEIHLFK